MPQKLLALGAHPDDVEFGCAAILIAEILKGNQAKVVVLTRGEAGSSGTPAEREQESRAAARIIGAEIAFLDFGEDCHIEYNPGNTFRLAREIRAYRPDIILAPHPDPNQHPDHSHVGKLARDAARLARFAGLGELKAWPAHTIRNLYFYTVTQELGRPDIIVDVSNAKDRWEQAMRCHETQGGTRQYVELMLAEANALGRRVNVQYAVPLYLNDPILLDDISSLTGSSRYF